MNSHSRAMDIHSLAVDVRTGAGHFDNRAMDDIHSRAVDINRRAVDICSWAVGFRSRAGL